MNRLTMPTNTLVTSGAGIPVAVPFGIPVTTMNTTPVAPPVAEQGGNWDGTVLQLPRTLRCPRIKGGRS
ncbi:hypothetical protein HNR17_002410 [Galbitalea soli]|nr:hypothetical protein [Galbitalea soli]